MYCCFISCVCQVGEKLGKLEVEKRQAVENEDYDKAMLKKVQLDEYRHQSYNSLQLYDLVDLVGVGRALNIRHNTYGPSQSCLTLTL